MLTLGVRTQMNDVYMSRSIGSTAVRTGFLNLVRKQRLQVVASSGGRYPQIFGTKAQVPPPRTNEAAQDLLAAGTALRNIGWLSFWSQLSLNVVAAVILLFSTGAASAGAGVPVALSPLDICTMGGVLCGLISTFLAWANIRTGRRIGAGFQDIRLSKVVSGVLASSNLNLVGLGASILGLQATIGSLVGKTLSSAATGAYYNPRVGGPPVALDVFSVQACANSIMAHFAAMVFTQWLLRVLNKFVRKEEEGAYYDPSPSAPPLY